VTSVIGYQGKSEREIISLAAVAEKFSEHPFARAILKKAEELKIDVADPSHFEMIPGFGVVGHHEGKEVVVGNRKLLERKRIKVSREVERHLIDQKLEGKTPVLVCENGSVVGLIGIADMPRERIVESIGKMRDMGIKNVVMLTGDNPAIANAIARQVGINEVRSELLPEQKVTYIKKLRENGHQVLMIGDGINDAPALATADVGIAMGEIGTDVTIETADIVLMKDDVSKVSKTIQLGRATLTVIRENILFAMIVNIIGIILAVHGNISPTLAAMIHEGNALLVLLNSARLIRS
jgi:P-type E1-E2 ATPase